jgi:hypothetical protein
MARSLSFLKFSSFLLISLTPPPRPSTLAHSLVCSQVGLGVDENRRVILVPPCEFLRTNLCADREGEGEEEGENEGDTGVKVTARFYFFCWVSIALASAYHFLDHL